MAPNAGGGRPYTRDELIFLRDSPLVVKPTVYYLLQNGWDKHLMPIETILPGYLIELEIVMQNPLLGTHKSAAKKQCQAERFTGRMGGERHRDEKRFKDREERDAKERPRGFENFSRDKDKNHEQDIIAELRMVGEEQNLRGFETTMMGHQHPENGIRIQRADEHPLSGIQKSTALAPLDTGTNGDEFFRLWATPKNDTGIASKFEANTESMTKSAVAAPSGKTSRFNKFFNQDEPSRKAEPQTRSNANDTCNAPIECTPPVNPILQSEPAPQERQPGTPFEGRDPPLPRLPDRHDEMRSNAQPYPHNLHDLNAQRESTGIQPTVRPEEMLHHLVNQRQHAISQSSFRTEQPRSEQTAFLMSLMREAQAAPEPQRTEQIILGHPPRQQPSRQLQHQQQLEREQELQAQRERVNSQRRPPGYFDESVYRGGPPSQHDNPRPQPTHILPRPPPGLEQLQQGWPGQPSSQHPPPQQFRPTAPPGLAGNVPRPMQMPQQVLPPGFQMNNFPPPEALAGPRNIPFNPAYFNGPPPGFLPPVMSPFAAEGMPAFPFDARGPPPPQGAFRRQ
ncbi:hypothetical protein DID88_005437 [Monilinia fructigena]|uniref:Uncharacterized protein n=1 Tax=Monilinia fructigena TaxID=38457 RepID=A0A395IZU7_9HELO|nr:hypothetical protein DID88_005437 [Monilinia fructigena]